MKYTMFTVSLRLKVFVGPNGTNTLQRGILKCCLCNLVPKDYNDIKIKKALYPKRRLFVRNNNANVKYFVK